MKRRKMKQVLIVGSGDVARRIIPWLASRFRVCAVVRRPEERAALRALGATPLVADLDQPDSLLRLSGIADYVLHCAPPPATGQGDPRTARLLAALMHRGSLPRRLIYISTTGVYGDCGGVWLDETRSPRPTSARGARRVVAEQQLRRFGQRTGCRVSLLRAPGIYDSAERLPLARILAGIPALLPGEDSLHTHVHADDLARACVLSLARRRGGTRCYNLGDHDALPGGDRLDLVADAFGLPRVPRLPAADLQAVVGPLRWSFLRESRRLDCRRIHEELAWTPQVSGVAALLAALSPAARARLLAAARTDG